MSEDGASKTEQPTDSRVRKAVEQGDVAQSKELAAGLGAIVGAGWIIWLGPSVTGLLSRHMRQALVFDRPDSVEWVGWSDPGGHMLSVVMLCAMLFAGLWVAGIGAAALVGGLGFRLSALEPKFSRINPQSGFKRLFGANGAGETAKSLLRMVILSVVGSWLIVAQIKVVGAMAGGSYQGQWDIIIQSVALFSFSFLLVSMSDAGFHWLSRKKRLMMSRHEVEDERKLSDGSPELKARQRQRRLEVLSPPVRKIIASATVVTVNPTHFAVALRYAAGEDEAPVVIARGRDALALAIIELAQSCDIPLISCPALTRSLYFTSKVNNFIHPDLYRAVAMVIAHVFATRAGESVGPLSQQLLGFHIPPAIHFDAAGRRNG